MNQPATITLRDGRTAAVRPLRAGDVDALTTFFTSLSQATISRYGPHPFDRATAEKLCAQADDPHTTRFVAELAESSRLIGYMILTCEVWEGDQKRYSWLGSFDDTACLAPVIADDMQNQGIGSQMGQVVLAAAREMGIRRVILMGGVIADNNIARRLYEKLGFRQLGEFKTQHATRGEILNYDMMVEFVEE